jgi:hypothetical protein
MEHVQNWPSEQQSQQSQSSSANTGSSSTTQNIHVSSTTLLIQHLNQVVTALRAVEDTIRMDPALRKSLQECPVPLDLLDLLDSSRINPDVFSRGLLREALGQLAGLRRRKLALEMLGSAVQSGIRKKRAAADDDDDATVFAGDETVGGPSVATAAAAASSEIATVGGEGGSEELSSPAKKKQRVA